MRLFLTVLFFSSLSSMLLAQDFSSLKPGQCGKIEVKLVLASGAPAAGVKLAARKMDYVGIENALVFRELAISDSNGNLSTSLPAYESFQLCFTLDGQVPIVYSLGALRGQQTIDLKTVAFPEAIKTLVYVKDAQGRPVSGLSFSQWYSPIYYKTDSKGCFNIYTSASSELEEEVGDALYRLSSEKLNALHTKRANLRVYDILIDCNYQLRGRVRYPDGSPAAGARISLGPKVEDETPSAVANEDGSFRIFHNFSEPFKATVEHGNFDSITLINSPENLVNLEIERGTDLWIFQDSLLDSTPLEHGSVEVFGVDSQNEVTNYYPDFESFSPVFGACIPNLKVGNRLKIVVARDPWIEQEVIVEVDGSGRQELRLKSSLWKEQIFQVQVLLPDGSPAKFEKVIALQKHRLSSQQTDSDGRCSIRAWIRPKGKAYVGVYIKVQKCAVSCYSLVDEPNIIQLRPGRCITVKALDSNGQAIKAAGNAKVTDEFYRFGGIKCRTRLNYFQDEAADFIEYPGDGIQPLEDDLDEMDAIQNQGQLEWTNLSVQRDYRLRIQAQNGCIKKVLVPAGSKAVELAARFPKVYSTRIIFKKDDLLIPEQDVWITRSEDGEEVYSITLKVDQGGFVQLDLPKSGVYEFRINDEDVKRKVLVGEVNTIEF